MNVTVFAWVLAISIWSQPTRAVKMDETTHDLVIQRLELGIESMDQTDSELPGIQARLADLYADRARLKQMNELSGECKSNCKASGTDRRKAIALYQTALPRIDKDQQGKIILQIAHLYTLNDQPHKSTELYQKIIRSNKDVYASSVKGLALASLAEIHFKKGDFKAAQDLFEKARRENIANRALTEYRLAWCQLNLGEFDKAVNTLVHLLKTPELLATQTTDGKAVDPTFVQDVSSDLARFLARTEVGPHRIALLKSLSPDAVRKTNLKMLATETDRLGKKMAAVQVWAAYVDEGQVGFEEKIEVQSRLAQIYFDMNRQSDAVAAFEKALQMWEKGGCNDADLCEDLKLRLRKMVTSWHKSQGKKPTLALVRAYQAYTRIFPEAEMLHWAAQVASTLDQHATAIQLFHQAALRAQLELKKAPESRELKNITEGSMLGEIEMAEAAKDAKAQESAYNFYLSVNANGPQAFQVRYQRAQLFYRNKRFKEAFNEFHYLANSPQASVDDLKVKSADLALDSLVALKDDAALQVRSIEYARLFPQRKTEYLKISRNATMNIVAANLKNDRSDYKANLAALNQVQLDGADETEKHKFYKNKIIIAQKALELAAVQATCDKFLALKLSKGDREWALAQKVWAYELQLDFANAYQLTKQMDLPHLSRADRELRLALLADLAGLSSRPHNEAYLRHATQLRPANLVRVTLIKNSPWPWAELDKHLRYLRQTPDLLAGIALETFARQSHFTRAKALLNTTRIAHYPAGVTLARHLELRDFHAFDNKIKHHRIYGYSDNAMKKTIRERLRLIGDSEKQAQRAIKRRDWTLQVMALSQLARENRRLHADINALPVPQRLNAEQKKQYQQLLHSQSQPYLNRAEKIESELSQMWHESNSVQNLQSTFITASPDLQKLYRGEIQQLTAIAPSGAQKRLRNLLNTPFRRPSQKDILLARSELRKNPFDISKAQALRELEAQGGRPAMVVYLDERISQLKTGKSL